MVMINTVAGNATIADESIARIIGPSPINSYTYVYGIAPSSVETLEDPAHLVSRLQLKIPLCLLTRPDGQPVWIKGAAVTMVRPPLNSELAYPPNVTRAVVIVAMRPQAVQQDVASAHAILAAGGAQIPGAPGPVQMFGETISDALGSHTTADEYKPWSARAGRAGSRRVAG
ncbi:hypothetical protein R1A27_32740 (plasmid) [Methylobacterium sp. NMS12]|uniref:hypothetical protein n=1 Tax=Methylobacterium sp. NMS12 TaxID=3079766 RepID=UPI003F880477